MPPWWRWNSWPESLYTTAEQSTEFMSGGRNLVGEQNTGGLYSLRFIPSWFIKESSSCGFRRLGLAIWIRWSWPLDDLTEELIVCFVVTILVFRWHAWVQLEEGFLQTTTTPRIYHTNSLLRGANKHTGYCHRTQHPPVLHAPPKMYQCSLFFMPHLLRSWLLNGAAFLTTTSLSNGKKQQAILQLA